MQSRGFREVGGATSCRSTLSFMDGAPSGAWRKCPTPAFRKMAGTGDAYSSCKMQLT